MRRIKRYLKCPDCKEIYSIEGNVIYLQGPYLTNYHYCPHCDTQISSVMPQRSRRYEDLHIDKPMTMRYDVFIVVKAYAPIV